ncbi:MAG: AAA family ATPase [Clostridiaceae bacterium]
MGKLILVTSPPASGKTTLARAIGKAMKETVYLDKDTLIPLSKKIFQVADEPYDRSSDFFEKNIRNLEYEVVLDFAFEAINYDSNVILNAPFSREIRDKDYMEALALKTKEYGAELCVIWVSCAIETTHKRMLERNSDRDTWKLENWDEYVKKINFNPPDLEGLLIYKNDTDAEAKENFENLMIELNK